MTKTAWTALLDAIRTKAGTTGKLTASSAKTAVDSIQTGSGGSSYDYPVTVLERTKTNPTLDPAATKIAPYCFQWYTTLNIGELPDTITEIGTASFASCAALAWKKLPAHLKTIGDSAFTGCGSLAISSIPDSVTDIGNTAFSQCISITTMHIPASVTHCGWSVFEGLTSLESLTIDASFTMDSWSFSQCEKLAKITINGNLTMSGDAITHTAETGALIIRYTGGVITMSSSLSTASSSHIGSATFPVYVSDALVSDYKQATNWAEIADSIKPLSEYKGA